MISKSEYNVLMMLNASPEIDEMKYYNELMLLVKDKLIRRELCNELFKCKYYITQLGRRAIEEYEAAQREASISDDTLTTAHEANDIAREANVLSEASNQIAKEANSLSKKANKKSSFANIIGVISGLIAIAALVVAIVDLCR